jgi:hypothetical protein
LRLLKSLGKGFLVATGLVWVCNSVALMMGGDGWLGLLYLLIMLLPVNGLIILKLKNQRSTQNEPNRWRHLLFSFQGVALSFWLFDVLTTYYAINVVQNSIELNPLGWPWGIFGAAAFYLPILSFSYILLFRLKEKICLYTAVPLTMLTVGMGVMNLMAGAQNFQVFVDTACLASGVRFGLLTLAVSLNLAVPLTLKRMVTPPKTGLSLNQAAKSAAA